MRRAKDSRKIKRSIQDNKRAVRKLYAGSRLLIHSFRNYTRFRETIAFEQEHYINYRLFVQMERLYVMTSHHMQPLIGLGFLYSFYIKFKD